MHRCPAARGAPSGICVMSLVPVWELSSKSMWHQRGLGQRKDWGEGGGLAPRGPCYTAASEQSDLHPRQAGVIRHRHFPALETSPQRWKKQSFVTGGALRPKVVQITCDPGRDCKDGTGTRLVTSTLCSKRSTGARGLPPNTASLKDASCGHCQVRSH